MKKSKWISIGIFSLLFVNIILFQNFEAAPAGPDLTWVLHKKGAGISRNQEKNPLYNNQYDNNYADQAATKVKILNASWYYTWGPDSLTDPSKLIDPSVKFVPMIWTATETGFWESSSIIANLQAQYQKAGKKLPLILLYNEPDQEKQGNLSPDLAAQYFVKTYKSLSALTDTIVTPVQSGAADKNTGALPWIDSFFAKVNQNNTDNTVTSGGMKRLAYHTYPDPVKLGYVPITANPNDPLDPFYSSPEKVEKAARKLAIDFLKRLHSAYRKYHMGILITEFGVADWGASATSSSGACEVTYEVAQMNRISPTLVKLFLQKVLPELSERAYIGRYSMFTNDDQSSMALQANAIFKKRLVKRADGKSFCQSTELTDDVGQFYANYKETSLCQRGESTLANGNIRETVSYNCAMPPKLPQGPANEWHKDDANQQYYRDLNPIEAGIFSSASGCWRGYYFDRSATSVEKSVVDNMSPNCVKNGVYTAPASEGWYLAKDENKNDVYRRTIDPTKNKVTMFILDLPWKPK